MEVNLENDPNYFKVYSKNGGLNTNMVALRLLIGTVSFLDALFAGFIWLLENLSSFTFIEDRHAMFYNP